MGRGERRSSRGPRGLCGEVRLDRVYCNFCIHGGWGLGSWSGDRQTNIANLNPLLLRFIQGLPSTITLHPLPTNSSAIGFQRGAHVASPWTIITFLPSSFPHS